MCGPEVSCGPRLKHGSAAKKRPTESKVLPFNGVMYHVYAPQDQKPFYNGSSTTGHMG